MRGLGLVEPRDFAKDPWRVPDTKGSMRCSVLAVAVSMGLALGCSSEPAAQPGASGSGSGVSGSSAQAGGGMSPSGGMSASGGMSVSAGNGGSVTGGGGATGGAGVGGGSGGSLVAGGSGGQAGAAGSSGAGGGGGSGGAGAAVASAGCGKAGRPQGGEVVVPNDRIYSFPASYDGMKPMPLVIALHGANNPNTILKDLSDGSRLEEKFVRAFPKSNGNAWSFMGGNGPDSQRISAIYTQLLADYCIDTSRVFLTGHSSGAQMSVQMACVNGGDPRFKALAPVAASKYCDTLSPVPVLYIQGAMDAQRGNSDGANVVAVFSASNTCATTSKPYSAIMGCNSDFDNQPVDPGCIAYDNCSKPTVWCRHNDNTYNNTDGHMHGWPCFASDAIADFFLSLP